MIPKAPFAGLMSPQSCPAPNWTEMETWPFCLLLLCPCLTYPMPFSIVRSFAKSRRLVKGDCSGNHQNCPEQSNDDDFYMGGKICRCDCVIHGSIQLKPELSSNVVIPHIASFNTDWIDTGQMRTSVNIRRSYCIGTTKLCPVALTCRPAETIA